MPSCQVVALEPAMAVVLAQHLHDAPVAETFSSSGDDVSANIRSETSNTAPSRLLLVSSGQNSRKLWGLRR